jgi:hypothetical protein
MFSGTGKSFGFNPEWQSGTEYRESTSPGLKFNPRSTDRFLAAGDDFNLRFLQSLTQFNKPSVVRVNGLRDKDLENLEEISRGASSTSAQFLFFEM